MFVDNDGERVWRRQVGGGRNGERKEEKRGGTCCREEGGRKVLRATEVEGGVGGCRRVEGKERK